MPNSHYSKNVSPPLVCTLSLSLPPFLCMFSLFCSLIHSFGSFESHVRDSFYRIGGSKSNKYGLSFNSLVRENMQNVAHIIASTRARYANLAITRKRREHQAHVAII